MNGRVQFYPSPEAEARAIRRAVARVPSCRVRTMSTDARTRRAHATARVSGVVDCIDGWGAAWLLLALAEEDAKTAGARALARQLRADAPSDADYARTLHAFVRSRVRFSKEVGEIFQSGAYTLNTGVGDCDDHFRLLYSLAVAGGLRARLGILHHGENAPPALQGPAHATAVLCVGGQCDWAETTVGARYGENPNDAARRLGLTSERSDIAREVVLMSSDDLPPIPPRFREHNDPAQVALDAEALQRLGYLRADIAPPCDPADEELRRAVLAFQVAKKLHLDGLLGDRETRPAIARALRDAGPPVTEGFDYTLSIGGLGDVPKLTKHISDQFLRDVGAMVDRFRGKGAKASAEDFLLVWLAESGIKNIPNAQGAPFGGLNQMGPDERKAAGFVGSFSDWLLMPLETQLPFVERYYVNATGGRFERMTDAPALYLLNFAPAFAAHAAEPDFILFRRVEGSPLVTAPEAEWKVWRDAHHNDAYAWNRGFDRRRDGTIRVGDLKVALDGAKRARSDYFAEVQRRLASALGSPPSSGAGKVAAIAGVALVLGGAALAWWKYA